MDDYGLGGVDCAICGNTGHIVYEKNGVLYAKECKCMAVRRSMRRIRRSGMANMLERYTFDAYSTPDKYTKAVKATAERYATGGTGWFYISGGPGSGKTHICTAVCNELITEGVEVYYMRWRDEVRSIKAIVNTEEVEERLWKLKTVPVLYIDDFLKGSATDADIRIAFEIINARYNDTALRTIISSEYGIEDVLNIDEALGSRIYERAKGYRLKAPEGNWRLME